MSCLNRDMRIEVGIKVARTLRRSESPQNPVGKERCEKNQPFPGVAIGAIERANISTT